MTELNNIREDLLEDTHNMEKDGIPYPSDISLRIANHFLGGLKKETLEDKKIIHGPNNEGGMIIESNKLDGYDYSVEILQDGIIEFMDVGDILHGGEEIYNDDDDRFIYFEDENDALDYLRKIFET